MLLVRLIIISVVALIATANMIADMDEQQAEDAFNCLSAIICVAKEPMVIKRLWIKCDPTIQARYFMWFKKIYGLDASDTPEFWNSYVDDICPKPREERREFLKSILLNVMEDYEKSCKDDPNGAVCDGVNKAMAEFQIIQQEYTLKGVCYKAGEAKNVVGSMKNMKKLG